MDIEEGKRGRGRGRGTRARGRRGRGRGRGKKAEETIMDTTYDAVVGVLTMEDSQISSTGSNCNAPTETVDSEASILNELDKENESEAPVICIDEVSAATPVLVTDIQQAPAAVVLTQTIDMEADISQLEAPTFTTLSRGPPEPMLRLKWNHKVSLIGEKVLNPMIHCCDQCEKPILFYGRMIPCKHVFCLKCARVEPIKTCPRCNDKVVRVEQSGLGAVFMCTHGGSRYGNTGCRRTYLSQRDLQAHINHRHVAQPPPTSLSSITASLQQQQAIGDLKLVVADGVTGLADVMKQRKLSESVSLQTSASLMQQQQQQRTSQMRSSGIGTIPPPGSSAAAVAAQNAAHTHSTLTQANIARINTANAQECHQGKVSLHQTLKKSNIGQSSTHQPPETVADASYYSSVLNSFGRAAGGDGSSNTGGGTAGNTSAASVGTGHSGSHANNAQSVGYGYESATNTSGQVSNAWQQSQYYR